MSPIKRLIQDFLTPPEATKSISVTPADVKPSTIETPDQASATFGRGLVAQNGSTSVGG